MTFHPHPAAHAAHLIRLGTLALALGLALPVAAQTAPDEDIPVPKTHRSRTVELMQNTDIEAVAQMLGAAMNRQILVDPRVKGTVSLATTGDRKSMTLTEAWRTFQATLRGLGFTVVDNAGLLKVVPEAEAKLQTGTVSVGQPTVRGDQVVTQIFRLNHENPNNLVAVLRPLISANNTINANVGNSTLIITDYADNLQRIAKIIAALDQPAASDVEVVPVRHALASDLAALVQKLGDGTPAAPGGANPGGATSVLVEPRSNSLIIRTANPARLKTIKDLIDKLDRPLPGGGGPAGNIWVVHLKNADAVKLAEVLRAAIASGTGAASSGGGSGASPSPSRPVNPTPTANPAATGTASAAATTPVSASAGPSTGGQIQADPSTNSLIISAPEPVYRQMRQVIDQLDTRRAQVYVESLIVKVDAEKAAEFGIQWQSLLGSTKNNAVGYSGTNFGSNGNLLNLTLAGAGVSSSTNATSVGQGLNVGVFNKVGGAWTLGALGHFLQTETGANILSTPNLVALDNEEAKIVIGSNVPFVTGSFTNTGTGNGSVNPFQTVERKDVGITLRIKSQIGEGGTIRMTVFQENSSLRADNTSITDKSAIETTVVIDDGATMVLGGLLKDEYGDTEGKVPGLGDIPLLGALFRNEGRKRTKSNLMLFLRPTVIRTPQAADQLTIDRYDSIRATQANTQPESRWLLPVDGAPVLPPRPNGDKPATPQASAPAPLPPAAADASPAAVPQPVK